MAPSPRLFTPIQGVARKSISRSLSALAGKVNPRALQTSKSALRAEKQKQHPSLAPRQVESWNLRPADGLSVKQIGDKLNLKGGPIFDHLIVCLKNGWPIDWVDVCREANFTPKIAEILEGAYLKANDTRKVSLETFCPPLSVKYEQSTLYRVMKSCGIDYQQILLISAAVRQESDVEKTIKKVLEPRAMELGQADKIELEGRQNEVERHRQLSMRDQLVLTCSELCDEGQLSKSVELLDRLVNQGYLVDTSLFYRVLKRCMVDKDLVMGRRIHALVLKGGYESNAFLANHIIGMYASHARLDEATQVFTKVTVPNSHMWASIILAHARHKQPRQAIKLYQQMQKSNVKPDNRVFVAVLKACASAADLASGKEVHADFLGGTTDQNDVFVGNSLVNMYAKCGSLMEARKVFDKLSRRNTVTWTALIAGYVQHGLGEQALKLFARMQKEGISPADRVIFLSLLKACTSVGSLLQGQQIHGQIQECGLERDAVIGSCLVDMYAKCGSLEDAQKVFDNLPSKDVVTWTAMITGYVQHGLGQEALALYSSMQQDGLIPADHFTFASLLRACASVGAVNLGKELHSQISKRGLEADVIICNSLVDMYAKCGSLPDARRVFDVMPSKDVVTWNALLNGHSIRSDGQTAMNLFEEMRQAGVDPDGATFISLLVACSHQGLVNEGQRYFKMMSEDYGIAPTINHFTCLVDLLGRSGCLDEAESVLKTMPFENNFVGWISLLTACKSYGDIERGKRCFDQLVKLEPENATPYVLLASMYAQAGRCGDADRIEKLRKSACLRKKPATAWIEVGSKVEEFVVGDERNDVSSKLRSMNLRLKEQGGHVPHTELVLKEMSDSEKEDALCGHAEKLALAYGLLNSPDGTTLLVTKNLRMCDDCHSSTKILSSLEKREIIVRDLHRVHHFVDGLCSCGDRH